MKAFEGGGVTAPNVLTATVNGGHCSSTSMDEPRYSLDRMLDGAQRRSRRDGEEESRPSQ
jgi:hypothetical protein